MRTPRRPPGFPFAVCTEGGLGSSVLSHGRSPASQAGLFLGADSGHDTSHSALVCQSTKEARGAGWDLSGVDVTELRVNLCGRRHPPSGGPCVPAQATAQFNKWLLTPLMAVMTTAVIVATATREMLPTGGALR